MPGPLFGSRVSASTAIVMLLVIAGIIGVAAAAFAYTAGWLSPDRLSPARVVDALSKRGGDPVGHRRNHAKGICFTGYFDSNGAGARLSTAPMLATGHYPVIGRFSLGTGDPKETDVNSRVRAMAVRIVAPDGEEWRSGMITAPVFPVATPQAFYELTVASDVDPATGKPDPNAIPRFIAAHPEFGAFGQWAQTAPWTASYADQSYNGLNAFYFVDSAGAQHAVRWSMEPALAPTPVAPGDLAGLGSDFLSQDLKTRLAQGPLNWRFVVTLAAPGDPTADASHPWPADRERVDVGGLVVEAVQDDSDGPCRDFNYDPTILPAGIAISDDPLLPMRSATYSNSFNRRTAEAPK